MLPRLPPGTATGIVETEGQLRATSHLRDPIRGPQTLRRPLPFTRADAGTQRVNQLSEFAPQVPELRQLGTRPDSPEVRQLISNLREANYAVRVSRGRKMRSKSGLFDELAASLQFPLYFGENWAALNDCLQDLEWLPPMAGFVLVWTEAEQILSEEDAGELAILREILQDAAEAWAAPIELGNWWDRPPIPFHVILLADSRSYETAARRWDLSG